MSLVQALRNVAKALFELAEAYELESPDEPDGPTVKRPVSTDRADPKKGRSTEDASDKATRAQAKVAGPVSEIMKTERNILTALAQAKVPLSLDQIGIRTGLSHKSGSFAKTIAAMRAAGYILGPGSAIALRYEGELALGDYTRLPEGPQLFDFWKRKVGGAGGKILGALRDRCRDQKGPGTLAELGAATGLSHNSGSFAKALAKLRRLELIVGKGSATSLCPELERAVNITFGVWSKSTGETVKVDRHGKVVEP